VTGTPAAATTALSVAQTQVPSARLQLMRILAPADIAGDYPAVFQPWSAPLTTAISAPVQYGDGAGGNLNGCAPFDPGSLSGKIVLVDRGVCFFSDKIRNIADGGGLIGIIGLIAPGEPFEGGFGGGPPITIPGYMISQANANLIKGSLDAGVTALFDPANFIPLVMHMVGSSSRGPSMGANLAKPARRGLRSRLRPGPAMAPYPSVVPRARRRWSRARQRCCSTRSPNGRRSRSKRC
jgi:hypothetical protein